MVKFCCTSDLPACDSLSASWWSMKIWSIFVASSWGRLMSKGIGVQQRFLSWRSELLLQMNPTDFAKLKWRSIVSLSTFLDEYVTKTSWTGTVRKKSAGQWFRSVRRSSWEEIRTRRYDYFSHKATNASLCAKKCLFSTGFGMNKSYPAETGELFLSFPILVTWNSESWKSSVWLMSTHTLEKLKKYPWHCISRFISLHQKKNTFPVLQAQEGCTSDRTSSTSPWVYPSG